jgi:RHS repeat-associated protein
MDPDVTGASVGTENGYTALAAGEPLPMAQPSDTNHIQFHGGFLEDQNIHTTQGTDGDMGYFYRMGMRHYSPALNRFMQRDPLSYTRLPNRRFPITANPYIYANNQPLKFNDRTGYQPCPGGNPNATPSNDGYNRNINQNFQTDPDLPNPDENNGNGGSPGTGLDRKLQCDLPYPEDKCHCGGCCIVDLHDPSPSLDDLCSVAYSSCNDIGFGDEGLFEEGAWVDDECKNWCCGKKLHLLRSKYHQYDCATVFAITPYNVWDIWRYPRRTWGYWPPRPEDFLPSWRRPLGDGHKFPEHPGEPNQYCNVLVCYCAYYRSLLHDCGLIEISKISSSAFTFNVSAKCLERVFNIWWNCMWDIYQSTWSRRRNDVGYPSSIYFNPWWPISDYSGDGGYYR